MATRQYRGDKSMKIHEIVKIPHSVQLGSVMGKGRRCIETILQMLPEPCKINIIKKESETVLVVSGQSDTAVAAGVRELRILIARKISDRKKLLVWKCMLETSRSDDPKLECIPLEYSNLKNFGPELYRNESLYSVKICNAEEGQKGGKMSTDKIEALVNLFTPPLSHVFEMKKCCSIRVNVRFGQLLFVVNDIENQVQCCHLNKLLSRDRYLSEDAISKFFPKLDKRDGLHNNAFYSIVPRIPDSYEFCSLVGHATVLLIDVVFIGEDNSEFATIKCVQEEGTRFYQLIEVTKRAEGTVCDCKFLEHIHDVRVSLNVCSFEDLEFAESIHPMAEWIVTNLREHDDGSFTMVTRAETFAILQIRRSNKTNYKYKHGWKWYLLTSTESEQCQLWSVQRDADVKKIPKDGSSLKIDFEAAKHRELELFNPQWIANFSIFENITVEKAFQRHFFELQDADNIFSQEPKDAEDPLKNFKEELESFMNCAMHIASYLPQT